MQNKKIDTILVVIMLLGLTIMLFTGLEWVALSAWSFHAGMVTVYLAFLVFAYRQKWFSISSKGI